jgi:hypothetical protein
MLERLGWKSDVVPDGAAAVEAMKSSSDYRIILMDAQVCYYAFIPLIHCTLAEDAG